MSRTTTALIPPPLLAFHWVELLRRPTMGLVLTGGKFPERVRSTTATGLRMDWAWISPLLADQSSRMMSKRRQKQAGRR
ncbi:uncharacterized protein BO95DRAFT_266996 [Aspergillus brunneoviolaceus CBS 621.78]|uniref:Uncharacterized protein n=1 Tax=Aspergillus brunneoviolaceus CBS 621.78 TaxID=1450534 RepID=A0ACD1FWX1_9EURO|nr:hypothetical protein BO95DRAFT_266996 [Aspergillus brunneoviolaceus CBS 621.78]RAH41433.1 hypothetical protein BO95DRAFT_266996 [Aspergillus brunneoviolaceus CBS 621.78]